MKRMGSKMSFVDSLEKRVVSTGKCMGCGAWIGVCPCGCLGWIGWKPQLQTECQAHAVRARVCPRYDLSMSKIETFVFGRERNRVHVLRS